MGGDLSETVESDCPLCSGDVPADFVETIASASAIICDEMSPDAFREWFMDEIRDPDAVSAQ